MASTHCLVVAVFSATVLIEQVNVYLLLMILEVVHKNFAIVLFLTLECLVRAVCLATTRP